MRISALTFCTLLATTALAAPAFGQEQSITPFPVRQYQDENGVDLATGVFTTLTPAIFIGSADMGLRYFREVRQTSSRDTAVWNITASGSTYTVGLGTRSVVFTKSGTTFMPVENNGDTLTFNVSQYTYTGADGTVAVFDTRSADFGNGAGVTVTSITYPSGRKLTYYYTQDSYINAQGVEKVGSRLQGVISNTGYLMHFTYASDTVSSFASWSRIAKVKGLNSATDSCLPTAFTCSVTGRPELSVAGPTSSVYTYTDAEGRQTKYTIGTSGVTAIRLPGSGSDNVSVSYTSGKATSVTNRGVTTGYAYADASGVRTVTVTRPGSVTRVLTFDIAKSLMLTDTNELGKTTSYTYDSNNRPARVTAPEGNYVEYTYDGRGNATQTKAVAKSGSGLSDIVATASYDTTCSNGKTCNQPNSTTDPRGNTTDYTYDSAHGGVLTVTAPAATSGANRAQTRVSYSRLDANGSPSATGIYVPTGTSTCQTGTSPSCVGTADEVKTSVAYGYGLLPSSAAKGAGDNSLTATSAMTYDVVGNLTAVDGPLAGTADKTAFRYNLNREQIGVVGPDPDGASSRKHLARKTTIASTGLVSKVEFGNVDGYSDSDWAAFATSQEMQSDYDSNRRLAVSKLVSGGTTYALSQNSYDNRGRPECSAIRMNSAIFGSLPSSACTLGTTGSNGPDRITKIVYSAASQVLENRVAVGTSDEVAARTLTYSNNGRLATLKDGENNLSTFEYDGHDRLKKTRFPVTTQGSNSSSTTDYEELTYDANSNVTSRRLRDGNSIGSTFDALNRITVKDLPGSEPDVAYTYDLLSRITGASQTGNALTFTYDALSRKLTEAGQVGTATSTYDLAGRRTTLALPGGSITLTYDRDVTGQVTAIRENGATSGVGVLATYTYDNLGRRTGITRGNGTSTSYSFDAVSRLTSLAQDLASTGNDLTIGSIGYNHAGQIITQNRSNDAYAWTGHGNGSTASVANGLNQLASIGGSSVTHDSKGNLTFDPTTSKTYGYSSENLLISSSGGTSATLTYDPMLRLYQVAAGSTVRFSYDGIDLLAETDGSGTLLRRYAPGPGVDETVVWYEGTGTSDRRWLHADERGSVVATSDSNGAPLQINKYDEFGKPQSGNAGRFQYTGQVWLSEIGLFYYKARMYAAHLGRFLQPDPTGYNAGPNLYAYVLADPIGLVDPLGLDCAFVTGSRILRCGDDLSYALQDAGMIFLAGPSGARGGGGGGGGADPTASLAACLRNLNSCAETGAAGQANVAQGFNEVHLIGDSSAILTLQRIFSSPILRGAMISAGASAISNRDEYGFWLQSTSTGFLRYPTFPGEGPNIYAMNHRPAGADIFFHFHWDSARPQGLSTYEGLFGLSDYRNCTRGDICLAQRYNFMIFSVGRFGLIDWADFRRRR